VTPVVSRRSWVNRRECRWQTRAVALHCPAFIAVVGVADDVAASSVDEALAALLRDERVAAVYATDAPGAAAAAGRVSEGLGLGPPNRVVAGAGTMVEVADLHRGETVLVFDRIPLLGRDGGWLPVPHTPDGGSSVPTTRSDGPGAPVGHRGVDIVRLEVGDDGVRVAAIGRV
jgi:hypothetical protein